MKKTLSWFLLLLFLFNLGGYYIVFEFKQVENHRIMQGEATNPAAHLVLIKVDRKLTQTENSIFRQTEEDEISYQGKMYDVVSSEIRGDAIYFSCLNDATEDDLNLSLIKQQEENTDNNVSLPAQGKTHKLSLNDFIKDYLPPNTSPDVFDRATSFSFFHHPSCNCRDMFYDIAPRPPRVSFITLS
jgi:hypothetical protein